MYQNSEELTKVICLYKNDIEKRKQERLLSQIVTKIVNKLLLSPQYYGYSKTIKDEVLQTSLYTVFNNINNFKIKPDFKIGKIIKLKRKKYLEYKYQKYATNHILITSLGKKKKKQFKGSLVEVSGFGWDRTHKIIEYINDLIFDFDMVDKNNSFAYITSIISNAFKQVINAEKSQYRLIQLLLQNVIVPTDDNEIIKEIDTYMYNFSTDADKEKINKMRKESLAYIKRKENPQKRNTKEIKRHPNSLI